MAKVQLRKSFVKPKWARKVALQGVGADLFASVGCRSAVKLWSLSGVHRIAKLSLRRSFAKKDSGALSGPGGRMRAFVNARQPEAAMLPPRYPSDLSDEEWQILEPLLSSTERRGRPPRWSSRRVADAVFYLLRSGCSWRMLPREYPPWNGYQVLKKWLSYREQRLLGQALASDEERDFTKI